MSSSSRSRLTERLKRCQQDLEATQAQIAELGYVMQGSVVKRTKRCGQSGCRCQRGPEHEHGPYYQWTRKIRAKTVTGVLTPAEARLYHRWIANGRRLRHLVARLYKISERAARHWTKENSSD